MAHSFEVQYRIKIHDDDPYSRDEEGSWNSVSKKSIVPGGPDESWGFDQTVDNEVRFRVSLGFRLDSSYDLRVWGQMDMWEGDWRHKGHKRRVDITEKKLQAKYGATTSLVIADQRISSGGDWVEVYLNIKQAKQPPPKLQFKPRLDFSLAKIVLNDEYYLRRPRGIDLQLDFTCFGVKNKISEWLSLSLPEGVNEILINKALGSRLATFPELLSRLSGSLVTKIKETYVWYVPSCIIELSANPSAEKRGEDQQVAFQKWVNVNGTSREYKRPLVLQLGFQYELHFEVKMTFDYSLVKNELSKIKQVENATGYYLAEFEKYMGKVEENVQIKLEVENINATPKVHKGKPVKVTKEMKKGQNTNFSDADGYTMSREEFVLAIKQGLYPGYHIRKLRGIETPVSDPDNTVSNNLG